MIGQAAARLAPTGQAPRSSAGGAAGLLRLRRWAILVALVACPMVARVSLADEVHMANEEQPYTDVQIVGMREGMLEFRSRTHGNVVRKPFSKVVFAQVDGQGDFNQAERLFQARQYAECIGPFELARQRIARGWLADWIDLRLTVAYDMTVRFDRAVQTFVALLSRAPTEAVSVRPYHIPGKGSHFNRLALEQIEQGLTRIKQPQLVQQLQLLKLAILHAEEDPAAEKLAAQLGGRASRFAGEADEGRPGRIQQLERLLEQGRYDEALPVIDAVLAAAPLDQLDGLLLLKARCQLALAKSPEQMKAAALTAMRVVVHFDQSRLVPEALFLVAVVHEKLGLGYKAAELYRRCQARPDVSGATAARASQALDRLGASPAPGQEQHER